ncbi:hypothetical protein DVK02_12920 [Halobellus sp. Atlit-31R]|nr:hypothetical protein DVK02_12920 [Halobellus sp. Atlit-31R]
MFGVVLDLLRSLGLGSQLTIAASIGLAAWYTLRVVSGAKTVGSILTNGVSYVVVVLCVGALAIGLGWVDPSIATATDHVSTAVRFVWDVSGGYVVDAVEGVIP